MRRLASSWSRRAAARVTRINSMEFGIDEAGRGALAGPLVVACVGGLPTGAAWVQELRDSKALSAKKRERLFEAIQRDCKWVATEEVSAAEIDRVNILQATSSTPKCWPPTRASTS